MRPGLWTGFFLLENRTSTTKTLESEISRIRVAGFPCGELDERNAFSLFVDVPENEMEANASELASFEFLSQIHVPKPVRDRELQILCEDRLIRACSIMGIRTMVTHPFVATTALDEPKSESRDYLLRYAHKASAAGLRLALENQIYPVDMDWYLRNVEDLGVNIDFAHALACGIDVSEMILKYGDCLYGLHVSDSDGRREDYHIMPGSGIVNWDLVFEALDKVRYDGDFHLEIVHERSSDRTENDAKANEAFRVVSGFRRFGGCP